MSELCGAPASTIGWFDQVGGGWRADWLRGATVPPTLAALLTPHGDGQHLIHIANVSGLAALADSFIYYKIGDEATGQWSPEWRLRVPPLPGALPSARPQRLAIFGDFGRGSNDDSATWNEYGRPAINTSLRLAEEAAAGNADLGAWGRRGRRGTDAPSRNSSLHCAVWLIGDVSYATGYLAVWPGELAWRGRRHGGPLGDTRAPGRLLNVLQPSLT